MSKLVSAVKCHKGNKYYSPISPLFNKYIEFTDTTTRILDVGVEYIMIAKFGSKVIVTDGDEEALAHAIDDVKSSIVEAVFGEFRENFRELNSATYDGNLPVIRSLLNKFHEKMFRVD